MDESKRKLNVLILTIEGFGHLNATLGIAKNLKKRGHNVKYAMREEWKKVIESYGLEFFTLKIPLEKSILKDISMEKLVYEMLDEIMRYTHLPFPESVKKQNIGTLMTDMIIETNEGLKNAFDDIKPDIVIIDTIFPLPTVVKSGIPWVYIFSCNPSLIFGKELPPPGSGLPTKGDYKELWTQFEEILQEKISFKRFTEYCKNNGVDIEVTNYINPSEWMNIYIYPKVLDYAPELPKIYNNFFRVEASIRECKEAFELPDCLKKSTQPLIYFSLGSLGSSNVQLMKKTLNILSGTPYRIIVSKGLRHEQIDLYENMWGEKYVNQLAILPLVDLVIHHGGNNSTTECLYFGKPAIVVPIFYDQLDNAQRIEEKRLGIRVDGLRIDEKEYKRQLLNAIETLLNDQDLKERLNEISNELKQETSLVSACDLLEKLAIEKKPAYID